MLLLQTMNLSENRLNEVWLNRELCLFLCLRELVKILLVVATVATQVVTNEFDFLDTKPFDSLSFDMYSH